MVRLTRDVTSPLTLSVLDLIPVRTGQTTAEAIAATTTMAQTADKHGYARYWVAEHHNMAAVASTNPAVLIGILAGRTSRIRLGSGGVMLPNHSPLVVAEQFALLEAAYPGRIDLGVGRAPGSDPLITGLLRSSGTTSDVDAFPSHIRDITALLAPEGGTVHLAGGKPYVVRATPNASSAAELWLLGSSLYSARLAAQLGLPYVFAHHFSGEGTDAALSAYRDGFTPSDAAAYPRTLLTVNVAVADDEAQAHALARPQLQQMARLLTGQPLGPLATVEEAAETEMTDSQQHLIDGMSARWVIGTPAQAATRIRALATRFNVSEVMVVPAGSASSSDPKDQTPARSRMLSLLAEQMISN